MYFVAEDGNLWRLPPADLESTRTCWGRSSGTHRSFRRGVDDLPLGLDVVDPLVRSDCLVTVPCQRTAARP